MSKKGFEIKSIKELIKEEHKIVKEYNDLVDQIDYEAEFSGNINEITKLLEKLNGLIPEINRQRSLIASAIGAIAPLIEEVTMERLRALYPYSALSENYNGGE